jgi:hypothetical protein
MGAPVPPFTGAASTQVTGSFSFSLTVFLFDPDGSQTQLSYFETGPATIHLAGDPTIGWTFDSGVGYIGPVPEPATVLLLSTSAAGAFLWSRLRSRRHRKFAPTTASGGV